MRIQCIPEVIPGALPSGKCANCHRPRIPYLPRCLCGTQFESEMALDRVFPGPRAPKVPGSFRIAHWSDLHLGSRLEDGVSAEVRLRSLLSALQKLEVDGLILSGDISRFGQRRELIPAARLFDSFGFGSTRRVVVPGNHDIPARRNSAIFQEVFETPYPSVREFAPGLHIAAFDSNILNLRTLFERRWVPVRGRVGPEAIQKVREWWTPRPSGVRLLVLHHHIGCLSPESPWIGVDNRTLRADRRLMIPLVDAAEILHFANEMSMDAVLHGHKHWYSTTGYRVGTIPVFNAGSVTRMPTPRFRLFDFASGRWIRLYRIEILV